MLESFFSTLGAEASARIAIVTKDMSAAYAKAVTEKVRLHSHRAFGVHSAATMIATVHLGCGGITLPRPKLPW